MKRELIISYAFHTVLIVIFMLASAFSRPMELPQKVYSVRIVAAPQPEVVAQPEKPPEPPERAPEPKPQVIETKPEPAPKPKPKPEPKPEPQPSASKPKETSPTGEGHITVDGSFDDDFYLNLVFMKVYRNWMKPATAAQLRATIYFRILRDGRIEGTKVEKSSGITSYDQTALRTIMTSAPFPELPDHHSSDHLGIHFEFVHNP